MSQQTVWLLDYPVQLGISVAEHVDAWMREFQLMGLSGESIDSVPTRLQQMVKDLTHRYATELSEPDRLRAEAAARGEPTVDLHYPVLPETEQTVLGWRQMLTEVDAYCRAQNLLTLERTPEQVALSDWVVEEFLRQLRGEAPRAWAGRRMHPVG